ncbi:MAG: hypothetical protein HXY41_08365 [Chloroflexi bacterium]|nr:hypothetical protein [Chloroflexota bacterium]
MTARLFAIVLLMLAGSVRAQTGAADTAGRAQAAYESGDYAAAINLYETLVSSDLADGNVYYNLGCAYHQNGDLSRALLNYLRAQAFIPRDPDLEHNLRLARARRMDVQGDERGWIEGLAVLTSGIVTVQELGWGALLAWAAGFGLLAAWILRPDQRAALRLPLAAAGMIAMFVLILFISRLWVSTNRPAAVVLPEQARVMSGPGETYLELFPLHAAAEVRRVETRNGWIRFVLPDGRQGCLPQESMESVWME